LKGEIYWIGEVNEENFKRVTEEILKSMEEGSNEITLFIKSLGGSTHEAIAFYDWVITRKKLSLTTIAVGGVESAAILVLLSGKIRKSTPNTFFLLHHLTWPLDNKVWTALDIEEFARSAMIYNERYWSIIEKKTKLSREVLSRIRKGQIILTAEQAKEKEIIDEILAEEIDISA